MTQSSTATSTATSRETLSLQEKQVKRACEELIKYVNQSVSGAAKASEKSVKRKRAATADANEDDLDVDDSDAQHTADASIFLTIATKIPVSKSDALKPRRIKMPHPFIYSAQKTCCLIAKDPAITLKEMIKNDDKLSNIITEVLSFSTVMKNYSSFEAKRRLRDSFDIFLADERIVPMMPKLLGNAFFKKRRNKIPLPIQIERLKAESKAKKMEKLLSSQPRKQKPDPKKPEQLRCNPEKLQFEVNKTFESTYVLLSASSSLSVPVGHVKMSASDVADNICAAVKRILDGDGNGVHQLIKNGWASVKSMYIKTASSVGLPIWLNPSDFNEEEDKIHNDTDNVANSEQLTKSSKSKESKDESREKKNSSNKRIKKENRFESKPQSKAKTKLVVQKVMNNKKWKTS